jgi:MEKHLA domain-containing protein
VYKYIKWLSLALALVLLRAQAIAQGHLSDYRVIRISQSGKRFLVTHATVWNIQKPDGTPLGQAATFSDWAYL